VQIDISDDKYYYFRIKTLYSNHDGDTVDVMVDLGMRIYRDVTLRAEAINSDELKGDTLLKAREQRDAATAWLKNRRLAIRTYLDPGSYDRYTSVIYDRDTGESFNDYMVKNGYAQPYHYKWS